MNGSTNIYRLGHKGKVSIVCNSIVVICKSSDTQWIGLTINISISVSLIDVSEQ